MATLGPCPLPKKPVCKLDLSLPSKVDRPRPTISVSCFHFTSSKPTIILSNHIMFLPLLRFSIIHLLIAHSLALPAGPSLESADGDIILLRPGESDAGEPWTEWTLPPPPTNGTDVVPEETTSLVGASSDPPKDTLWPKTTGGHYYIRFYHPGKSMEPDDGKSVLYVIPICFLCPSSLLPM